VAAGEEEGEAGREASKGKEKLAVGIIFWRITCRRRRGGRFLSSSLRPAGGAPRRRGRAAGARDDRPPLVDEWRQPPDDRPATTDTAHIEIQQMLGRRRYRCCPPTDRYVAAV